MDPLMPALADILHPIAPSWSDRINFQSFSLPFAWRSWLFDTGSLTARLKALRPGQFRVQVLKQYYAAPTRIEQSEMGLCANQKVWRSEEHTSELQSRPHLVCRLLLEKKNNQSI